MFLSLTEREVRPRDGDRRQGASERKDAWCPGNMGRRLRAGRLSGSGVKTAGREEVSGHMDGGVMVSSEMKSRRQKAKEQREAAASLRH